MCRAVAPHGDPRRFNDANDGDAPGFDSRTVSPELHSSRGESGVRVFEIVGWYQEASVCGTVAKHLESPTARESRLMVPEKRMVCLSGSFASKMASEAWEMYPARLAVQSCWARDG